MTSAETMKESAEERAPVKYRSVSQVRQYLPEMGGCPYQYYLQRRERVWQKPAAWLPQGTAVHAVIEDHLRSGLTLPLVDAETAFTEHYAKAVGELTEITPNFNYWFWSGPYNGEKDLERRHRIGIEQVGRWYAFTERWPEHRPSVYGDKLAVELEFDVHFGDVQVKGFIDQVAHDEPTDVKSGNKPGDPFQLGTYGVALHLLFDVSPKVGYFWMGKTGKLTKPIDITDWTYDRLADTYGRADEGIREERFDPEPEPSKCRFCTVQHACEFSLA